MISSSSSAMPPPPSSPSSLLRQNSGVCSSSKSSSNMSVTIISNETLPTYSSERFYLISEIEVNSQEAIFLDELDENNNDDDDETGTTGTQATVAEEEEDDELRATTSTTRTFPPYIVLYLLWRPDCTKTPQEYVESTILNALQRLQEHVEHVNSSAAAACRSSPSRLSSSSPRPHEEEHETTTNEETRSKSSVYLVVDRLVVSSDDSTTNTTESTTSIEALARAVASHPTLRESFEGVTVCQSNHIRAAPGLEACVDAIGIGARDRRQRRSTDKSLLGIVAQKSHDLLGLQNANVTDAAQGVQQIKSTAEWNRQGNLETFAYRAHDYWRFLHGIPADSSIQQHQRPKRIRRNRPRGGVKRRRNHETLYDLIGVLSILMYIVFHFGHVVRDTATTIEE